MKLSGKIWLQAGTLATAGEYLMVTKMNLYQFIVLIFMASSQLTAHATEAIDEHAQHRLMALQQKDTTYSSHDYQVPEISLIDMNYQAVLLPEAFVSDKPVVLNFIYTSCTTICPILSATFSQIQRELGTDSAGLRMISISIDPEQDSPERLQDYARRFKSSVNWHFLTGDIEDIINIQKALDAYRGDKMNHIPLTFLYSANVDTWIRMEGFPSAAEIVAEYRELLAQ
jgi:protein SCO1/2